MIEPLHINGLGCMDDGLPGGSCILPLGRMHEPPGRVALTPVLIAWIPCMIGLHGPRSPGRVAWTRVGSHGPWVGSHGPRVGSHGRLVELHGPQVGSHRPRFESHGPRVGSHGPWVGSHGRLVGLHGPQVGSHGLRFESHGRSGLMDSEPSRVEYVSVAVVASCMAMVVVVRICYWVGSIIWANHDRVRYSGKSCRHTGQEWAWPGITVESDVLVQSERRVGSRIWSYRLSDRDYGSVARVCSGSGSGHARRKLSCDRIDRTWIRSGRRLEEIWSSTSRVEVRRSCRVGTSVWRVGSVQWIVTHEQLRAILYKPVSEASVACAVASVGGHGTSCRHAVSRSACASGVMHMRWVRSGRIRDL